MRLWIRRSAARASLLTAMAAVCLVVGCLAITMIGAVMLTQAPAVRETLSHAPVRTSGVEAQTPVEDDRAAQDAAVHRRVASLFPGLGMRIATRVDTTPLGLSAADAAKAGVASVVLLQDDAAVSDAIRTTSGDAAVGDGAVAIQDAAAKRFGLAVGDAITIPSSNGDVTLEVTATWLPRDPAAPIWFGDPSVVRGEADDAVGPFIVDAATLARFSTVPIVNWIVTSPDDIAPAEVSTLASGFDRLPAALGADPAVTSSQVTVVGDGAQTAHSMQDAMDAAASVLPLPVAILAVGTVLALVLLARLLTDVRAAETTLLRARGAAIGVVVRATAVESTVVSLVGTAVGTGIALLILVLVYGRMPPPWVAVVPPLLVVVAAVAVGAAVAFGAARSALGAAPESGRARSAVSAGLTVLVVLAAAFALWRFLGEPASGVSDAAAILAPPLALLAAALIGLAAFGPLARVFDAIGARAHRFDVTLPARQLGRGLGFFTAPAALVVLAIAAGVLGAGYQGTWTAFNRSAAIAVNGSDLRVDTASVGPLRTAGDSITAPVYAALPGATAALPVMVVPAAIGDAQVSVVGAASSRLAAVEGVAAASLDLAAIRAALPAPRTAGEPALPRGAAALDVSTSTNGAAAQATLWLCDDGGELIPLAVPSSGSVRVDVPAATGRWRLVAVDVTTGGAGTWTLDGLGAVSPGGTTALLGSASGWKVIPEPFGTPAGATAASSGIGMQTPSLIGTTARLMPGTAVAPAVVLTDAFASAHGQSRGSSVDVEGDWWSVTADVTGTVPVVPGTSEDRSVLFDLPTLQRAILRASSTPTGANQAWVASDDPGAVLPLAQRVSGGSASVTVADTAFAARFVGSAFVGLALGGLAVIALAIIALAAVAAALLRRRRNEIVVLRALGFSARQQVRTRRAELSCIAIAAGVLGALAGMVVTWLVAPALARRTVVNAPDALPAPVAVDLVWLAAAVVVAAVAAASVIAVYGGAIRRQAADTEYREETR
ncbi:FtsX-like permease family protein [Microbacterium rhizosphaerae]|uniref:FtsX-like permease family protein n=1 Tax=Microbacterium rhizosphaerae TaxID=1678237 RepID=A0ABZ0SNI9_9MICO|nr:FtsX-like permease family protein [Microbacterium rhizosphaerae]WPR90045.1 FtsX-like permease family protein [Microbacterium rhizosphaerae]